MTKQIGAAAVLLTMMTTTPAYATEAPLHQWLGAPDDLTVRLNLRSRVEAIDGQFRPNRAASDAMVSLRTMLFAEYDFGPLRVGGEIIDARAYGETMTSSASANEVNTFEPVQAYVALDFDGVVGAKSKAAVTFGRFVPDIGSQRLIGRVDFPDTVNAFTGVNVDWRSAENDRLFAFWGLPTTHLPNDPANIRHNRFKLDRESRAQQLFGASFVKADAFNEVNAEVYVYRLVEADSPNLATRDRHLLTYGTRLNRVAGKGAFDFDIEAALQTGRSRLTTGISDLADISVMAHFVHAELGKLVAGEWSPRVSAHFDLASGDGPNSKTFNRFDTLFGGRRADFGPTSLYGPLSRANLVSGGLRLDAKPNAATDGFVMYRALWLDSASDSFAATGVRDKAGTSGTFAGHQIEARVRHWIIPKRLRIEGGGAYLAKRHFLERAPNAPTTGDTRYFYLDFVVDL